MLNELAEAARRCSDHLFANVEVTRFDAAQIDDHLDASVVPSVVLMNPPFSAVANVDRRMADAALRHIASALGASLRRWASGRHHRRKSCAGQPGMDATPLFASRSAGG